MPHLPHASPSFAAHLPITSRRPPPCHRPQTQILLQSAHLNSFNLPKHVKLGKKSFADSLASEVSFSSNQSGPCGILAFPLESSAAGARGGDPEVRRLPASGKIRGEVGAGSRPSFLRVLETRLPRAQGPVSVSLCFAPDASPGPGLKTAKRSKVVPVRNTGPRGALLSAGWPISASRPSTGHWAISCSPPAPGWAGVWGGGRPPPVQSGDDRVTFPGGTCGSDADALLLHGGRSGCREARLPHSPPSGSEAPASTC